MCTGPVPLRFAFIAVLFGCSLDAGDKQHKTERARGQEHGIPVGTGAMLGWKCKNSSLPRLLSSIKKVNISQVGRHHCKIWSMCKEQRTVTVCGTTTEHGDLKILHTSAFHTAENKKGKEEKSMNSINKELK